MFPSLQKASTTMNMHCFLRNFTTASSPLVPFQLPSKMEAHIWYIIPDEVKSANLHNQYLKLLSPCEKENVMQMHGEKLRKSALLARALVRTTLSRYLTHFQIEPQELKFRKNMYGKPELDWQNNSEQCLPSLQFNISHTSSLIACGVTLHSQIGIDVEDKGRRINNNLLAFAKRYFSPKEIEVLTDISDPESQRQEFIKLWTLKEAYVKALGRGFSATPFNTFTIQFNATSGGSRHPCGKHHEATAISVESSNDLENSSGNLTFALMELSSSHYSAICMEKDRVIGGEESVPMKLKVWRTIPLVEDECVSGTEAALPISGFA